MVETKKELEWGKLKLVSVAFKEASLDTPSFRASVNFFHNKVQSFEDWIERSVAFFENRYTASFGDFQRAQQTFLTQLLPPPVVLSNGFVANQSYTPLFVEFFNNEYSDFSTKVLKMLSCADSGYPKALLELMNNAIEPYKARRLDFEEIQAKYDTMLARYNAMKVSNTSIEPAAIRDEAFQIYEVRKSYLKMSLELVGAISTLKLSLDKFLLQATGLVENNDIFMLKDIGKKVDLTATITENLRSYSAWVLNAIEAAELMQKDIIQAKQQVTDYTLAQITPSREISDYNVKEINFPSLMAKKAEQPLAAREKSGWLYMKTTVGTPSRQVWVRRWCFLRNSVFGLFLMSPSKTYVEESDKFGVLLAAIRYDLDEDRRFCFEIKINEGKTSESVGSNQIRIVLQAESLKDLKEWLTAFEAAQRYAVRSDVNSPEHNNAFRRFSPEYFEFASSTTTSVDQLITTYDQNSLNLFEILDRNLTDFDLASVPGRKFYHFQMASTPISTKMTQVAILGNLYKQGPWLPSAILANVWGSANWNDYATFYESQQRTPLINGVTPDGSVAYPDFFPEKRRIEDIQFKSLFFSINEKLMKFPSDLLLFNFTAFWCPNKRQKFSAICYVTIDRIFCYMDSMGFICLTHKRLNDLASVEVDSTSDFSLKLYEVDGTQLKLHVFFTDRRVIATKLQCLLENTALSAPRSEEDMLRQLDQIDSDFQEKRRAEKLDEAKGSLIQSSTRIDSSKSNELSKSFWSINATSAQTMQRRKEFQYQFTLMYHHVYDIPCKGLMHVMFGDNSSAFPRSLFLSNKDSNSNISWNWIKESTADGNIQLVRALQFRLNMTNNFLNNLHTGKSPLFTINQRLIKAIENKYYEVDQDPVIVKVPLCHLLRIKTKYVIVEAHESSANSGLPSASGSLLYLYYKVEFIDAKTKKVVESQSMIEKMILKLAIRSTNKEYLLLRKIIRYYLEKIGKHGKVIKAIKLCGMIGVANIGEAQDTKTSNSPDKGENIVHYTVSILFKLLLKLLVYRVTSFALLFIRLVFSLILTTISNITHINKNLLFGLLASVIINVFLSGKSTIAYWAARRTENVFHDYMQGKHDFSVQRAISIKDIDLLSRTLAYETDNIPFQKFNESHAAENQRFGTSRLEIAERRNDLLVELKILQNMERELVKGNYRTFLLNELDKCHAIEKELSQLWKNDTKLQDYCCSCSDELHRLSDLLL